MNTPPEIQEVIDSLRADGLYQQADALARIEFESRPDYMTYAMAMYCGMNDLADVLAQALIPIPRDSDNN